MVLRLKAAPIGHRLHPSLSCRLGRFTCSLPFLDRVGQRLAALRRTLTFLISFPLRPCFPLVLPQRFGDHEGNWVGKLKFRPIRTLKPFDFSTAHHHTHHRFCRWHSISKHTDIGNLGCTRDGLDDLDESHCRSRAVGNVGCFCVHISRMS